MKLMLITKADQSYENLPDPMEAVGGAEGMAAMGKFIDEMVEAGILLSADGLKPSRFGKRVDFNGAKKVVTDGPFTETKELISGFFIIEVPSMEEGMKWVNRFPSAMRGPWTMEVRPLWEPEDFSPEVAADVAAREAKGAAQQAAKAAARK